jgi:hypothetical protein
MKKNPLIASILAIAASAIGQFKPQFRHGTFSRRTRGTRDYHDRYTGCDVSRKDDGLPRSYPGAKLARLAAKKKVGVKHFGSLGTITPFVR